MAEAKFEVKQGKDRQWYFVLVAVNGEPVATSEGYTTKQSCIEGCNAVKIIAQHAIVVVKG